jgi:AraC-like DNA-binding protein
MSARRPVEPAAVAPPAVLAEVREAVAALLAVERPVRVLHLARRGGLAPELAYRVRFTRLSFTLSGVETCWLFDGDRRRLVHARRGEAVFVPAGAWTQPVWKTGCRSLHFLFGRGAGVSFLEYNPPRAAPTARKLRLPGLPDERCAGLLRVLGGLAGGASRAGELVVEAFLRLWLEAYAGPRTATPRRSAWHLQRVRAYLQDHLAEPVSRAAVAAHFQLSPEHLSRLVRREADTTFQELLGGLRLARAQTLLRESALTVDEVAAACGFSSTSYFCRAFKRGTRLTPSEYRR